MAKLPRNFYLQPTLRVAEELLGKVLVHQSPQGKLRGRITETEAYIGPEDLACHASKGRTPRTEIMFGKGGHAYVYFIYGMYDMFNIVTEKAGHPAAVLVRSVEVIEGFELAVSNRKIKNPKNLTNGPGKLCQAFGIDRSHNGLDLKGSTIFIEDAPPPKEKILTSPRIGIDYAKEWKDKPFRFFL